MGFKKRWCGFKGHDSYVWYGYNFGKIYTFKLVCKKCDYRTKWFEIDSGA